MAEATDQSPHNVELQALRGIAATVVMVHHGLRTLTPGGWAWTASETPLNAHAAVVVFFVLSGYVLSKSLVRRGLDRHGVTAFYVRRAFRIYPALWTGILLGACYLFLVRPLAAGHLSSWTLAHFRPEQIGPTTVIGSLVGANNFLLPTAWTITVELCASVLLPALVWAFLRRPWSALPIMLALALLALVSGPALRQVPFFLVDFSFGCALACLPQLRGARIPGVVMVLALGALLFTKAVLPWSGYGWAISMVEGLTSAVIVAGLIGAGRPWMRHPWLVAIGDWSYSIYLLHLPVAFAVAQVLDHSGLVGGDINRWALLVALMTVAVTVPLSALVYRYIEVPGIAVGAQLLRWLGKRSPAIPKAREQAS